MGRINFYQLLDLPINPPENDQQVIEEAIKKKQMAWSRLRNHPTKGIQARHYISLLPEIRKVMTDEDLRQKEAGAAVEELKKRLEAIFQAVDRHIDLVGCKGEVLEEEIEKIAARHDIKPPLVQKRVARWRKKRGSPAVIQIQRQLITGKLSEQELDKIAEQHGIDPGTSRKIHQQLLEQRLVELDEFVSIQVRKGYMTQSEISGLAAVFPFDEGEILRRIRCPINKSAKKEETEAYQIDSTVEQVIRENLKIVGHDSLYGFLGLFPGSSLDALQKKTTAKENEIRKIAQKDAVLTASGVLVGQCISLFKSDESRYAYDLSRARLLLNKLNTDIDLAATGKTIPREQYDYLVRQAIRFGTHPDKAKTHIRDYCKSQGWTLVLPKKKINFKRYLLVASIATVLLGLGGGIFWYVYYSQQRLEIEYLQMQSGLSQQKSLEAQLAHVQKYITNQSDPEYVEKAQQVIEGLHKRIEFRDLKNVQKQKAEFEASQAYEKIEPLVQNFMTKHPVSAHNAKLKQELSELPDLIDKRDYERIQAIPPDDFARVASALSAYLNEHPKGAFVRQVDRRAQKMAQPYYQQLVRELESCEKSANWTRCVELSAPYIALYKDSRYALRLKKRRDEYARNSQGEAIVSELQAKAGGRGADPAVLTQTYKTYLAQYPYSPARQIIEAEIETLEVALNRRSVQSELSRLRAMLPHSKGRFREKANATVDDKTTGLTWVMIDSQLDTRECMTLDEAKGYIDRLKTGGYSNWRLPTAKEMQGFYRDNNLFRRNSAQWYWSADQTKRYSGGWNILVDVVTPSYPGGIKQRNADECGWVRPVRP
ncbi:MAG: DUF1566 domain-containing protein [Desulfobacterales bacterium]|nr:DUF1566 domain-containing protein [Desulfobacterales bacterium]